MAKRLDYRRRIIGLAALLALAHPLAKVQAQTPEKPDETKTARTDSAGDLLPAGALARLGTARFRPGGPVAQLVFSPDGKLLASSTGIYNYTVGLWDMLTGRERHRFQLAGGVVERTLAFTPDGKALASLGTDRVQLWDVVSGKELESFPVEQLDNQAASVAFARDGKLMAVGCGSGTVYLWEWATKKKLLQIPGRLLYARALVTIAPDSKTLTAAVGATIHQWDVATGKELRHFRKQQGYVSSLTYSPDGRLLASAGVDNTIRFWDAATGQLLRKFGHHAANGFSDLDRGRSDEGSMSVAFAPDGRTLASSSGRDRIVRLWETATGKEVRQLEGHVDGVGTVTFTPDGLRLVSGGNDGTIRFWDIATGKELRAAAGHQAGITQVAFLGQSQTLASFAGDNTVRIWDTATSQEQRRFSDDDSTLLCAAVSPDGKVLATNSDDSEQIRLWDPATGKLLRSRKQRNSGISGMVFAPDGKKLVAVTQEPALSLWDLTTDKEPEKLGGQTGANNINGKYVTVVAFSPDGSRLTYQNGEDQALTLMDLTTGKEVRRLKADQNNTLTHVTFSPDGKLLAAIDFNHEIWIWSVATGKALHKMQHPDINNNDGFPVILPMVVFSPDGKLLASVGNSRAMCLWEVATGKEIHKVHGHAGGVSAVAFAPDGQTFATGGMDNTVLVWSIPGLREAMQLPKGPLAPQELDVLWTDLGDHEARKAYRAVWTLTDLPQQALPLLRERLRPVVPIPPQRLAKLIDELDSPQFGIRQQATEQLAKLAELAEPALQQALAGQPTLETRRRLEQLLDQLAGALPASSESLRALRAITALEMMGTAEAQQLLQTLTRGAPGAVATREARGALDRLARRKS